MSTVASLLVVALLLPTADPVQLQAPPIEELLRPIPPTEPQDALKTFEIIPGFRLELAAHEPLVVDPVAAAFDEDGRLYVAEMVDYPFKPKDGEPPLSRIRLLEDTDGDGRFDRSDIFAEAILWPAGIACWKQGIFVAAAPHLWYLKDTDGDRHADVREIVFTGFGTQNQQAMVNNLQWGMDHWIYGSAAGNGGEIQLGAGSEGAPVSIEGTDFRFDPRNYHFEPITGRAQFGNTFDDWGNRFLCSESVPTYQEVLPRHYLSRNPDLPIPEAMKRLVPGVTPIFRSSPVEGWRQIRTDRRMLAQERDQRSAGASHHVLDGAAGVTIYRGTAFPPEFRGDLFIGDAQNNLVHRRKLKPDGILFKSQRADAETEFLRSSDNWFRPVNFVNAPDGTLLVLDMAREIIESIHIPTDVFSKLDLTRGRDRGRIYRIVPDEHVVKPAAKLSSASTALLVDSLVDANAWTRETAGRLLFERQDPAALSPLRKLFGTSNDPLVRLQVLYALQGMDALSKEDVGRALVDSSAGVREHAVRLAEPWLERDETIRNVVLALAEDDAPRIRFQVSFSLGSISPANPDYSKASRALASIATRDAKDPWIRTAVLTSCRDTAAELLRNLHWATSDLATKDLSRQLAFLVGRKHSSNDLESIFLLLRSQNFPESACREILLGIGAGLRSSGLKYSDVAISAEGKEWLTRKLESVRRKVADPKDSDRSNIELLTYDSLEANVELFRQILADPSRESMGPEIIRSLGHMDEPGVPTLLLEGWQDKAASLRQEGVVVLCSRATWIPTLLDAIGTKEVSLDDLSFSQRSALRHHRDEKIRAAAAEVLPDESFERRQVLDRYSVVLRQPGDVGRGKVVFEKNCMNCHQIGGQGHVVGPNLVTSRNRSSDILLTHILDPNREVQPVYAQHVIADREGRVITGLLVAETPTSLTLTRDGGVSETILKANIEERSNSGRSLMPEGLEKTIDEKQMADLLAYLVSVQYDVGSEPGYVEPRR